jgi:hypothetical protein
MVDLYPNFFHSVEHKLLAYSQGSDLLSRSVHRSKGDKQNESSIGYPWFRSIIPRTLK